MKTVLSLLATVVLTVTPMASPLAQIAQTPSLRTGSVRVTLVAAPTLVAGSRTIVRRLAQRSPSNLIMVDPSATPEDLAYAIGMMNALRAQYGERAPFDVRATPTRTRLGVNWSGSAYRAWLVQQLGRLRQAEARPVPGIGLVRAVQISLPSPNGRLVAPRPSTVR